MTIVLTVEWPYDVIKQIVYDEKWGWGVLDYAMYEMEIWGGKWAISASVNNYRGGKIEKWDCEYPRKCPPNAQEAADEMYFFLLSVKIITLLEFFNFVSEASRFQYEWSSDCWCIWKSLGVNACLQWRNVFSFHWSSVFEQFFAKFSMLSLTAHAR
jgi:hypothetical protein